MTAIFAICGKPESDHHSFQAVEHPPGCVCDPKEWGDSTIPPVCKHFVMSSNLMYPLYCDRCEHLKECHEPH